MVYKRTEWVLIFANMKALGDRGESKDRVEYC